MKPRSCPPLNRKLRFLRLPVCVAAAAALMAGAENVRAASASYTGTAADGIFDTGTNWSTGTAPGDTTAGDTTNADVATFLAAGTTTVTLSAQRNLGSIDFGAATGSTALAFTIGATTGPAFLLSSGGTIISNATGVSEVVNAPLVLENAAGGTSGSYTFEDDTPGTSRLLTIGGTVTGAATSGSTTLTLTGSASTTQVVGGAITDGAGGGTLAVVKNGATTWQLTGTNTYTGGSTVNAGTLRTTNATSTSAFGSGAITLAGGTLAFGATTTTITNPFVITAGTTSFLSAKGGTFTPSALTGTGNLTFTPNGTGITDSFTDFKNFAGTVEVANSLFLRAVTGYVVTSLQNANLVLDTGGTFNVNFGTNSTNTFTFGSLAGGGTIGGSATGSGTFTFNVGGNNASTTFSGTIVAGGTATALTKSGTGTLTLTGANTYTGLTTINAGTLNVNGVNALGGANYAGLTINGGTLQFATTLTSSGDITLAAGGTTAKPVTIGAGGATIDTNGNTVTLTNTIGNGGTGAFTKAGAGTLTLSVANTYTGGTNVTGGMLTVAAGGTLGTGGVTVATGTTLTLNSTANTSNAIADGATLNLNGTLALTGTNGTVQETVGIFTVNGVIEPLGRYGSATDTTAGVTPLASITGTGEVLVTAVPEPSTWALLFGGIFGLTALSMRRRRCM